MDELQQAEKHSGMPSGIRVMYRDPVSGKRTTLYLPGDKQAKLEELTGSRRAATDALRAAAANPRKEKGRSVSASIIKTAFRTLQAQQEALAAQAEENNKAWEEVLSQEPSA